MASDGFSMPLLTGSENFASWKVNIQRLLDNKGLRKALLNQPIQAPGPFEPPEPTEIPPDMPAADASLIRDANERALERAEKRHEKLLVTYEDDQLLHSRALGATFGKLAPRLRNKVKDLTTATQVLLYFEEQYLNTSSLNTGHLVQQLALVKKGYKESVDEYFTRVITLRSRLEDIGKVYDDDFIKTLAMQGVDKRFGHMEPILREKLMDQNFTLDNLANTLLAEEMRMARDHDDKQKRGDGAAMAAADDVCNLCKKKGHWARDCPNKGKAKNSGKGKKPTGNRSKRATFDANANASSSSTFSKSKDKMCDYCGRKGHIRQTCFMRKQHEAEAEKAKADASVADATVLMADAAPPQDNVDCSSQGSNQPFRLGPL